VFGHLKMPLRVHPPTSPELGANGFEAAHNEALPTPVGRLRRRAESIWHWLLTALVAKVLTQRGSSIFARATQGVHLLPSAGRDSTGWLPTWLPGELSHRHDAEQCCHGLLTCGNGRSC
jgi:hypothetical protein